MKQVLYSSLLLVASLASCTSSPSEDIAIVATQDAAVELSRYKDAVFQQRGLLADWAVDMKEARMFSRAVTADNQKFQELKTNLLPQAYQFASELSLTQADVEEMLGVQLKTQQEYEEALVGVMLFTTMANFNYNLRQSRGGTFLNCLGEVVGIAEGAALVTALGRKAVTKATLKAALKLAARVGGRTIAGVGLALMAAEMAYCMW